MSSPSGVRRNGRPTIATVPSAVIVASANAASSRLASLTDSMATIAEAPQMPVPVAISSVSGPDTPRRRPITSVAANVTTRLPRITTIVRRPRSPTVPRLSRMPSSATPMRRIRREATRMPGASDGRRSPLLAITAPSASAQISALVPET